MANLTIGSGLFPNPKIIETIRSCFCEMNRVKEINLASIPGSKLKEIFQDLPNSAPQLHTLCIRVFAPGFSIHEDFLCDTERLQCVDLIKCYISWDSRLLSDLTRLSLEDSLKANASIIQVLHALQRMPALTDLRLIDSIPDGSDGSSTYPVVDLPCLRILNISSGVGPLTTVLRHITFPNSAILNLTCEEKQSTQIDFSNFISVLSTKFLLSLVIRSLSLRISDTPTRGLEFCLWTTAFNQDCFPSPSSLSSIISSPAQLQLVLSWPSPQRHSYVKALTSAFNTMSLPFLTQLQISTLDYIDSKTWVETFGKLPLLKQVCVQKYAHSFLEALVYKTEAAEKSRKAYRSVSFPKLRYIHLEGIYFEDIDPSLLSVETLLNCLMERCERKAAVQVLRLDDCYYISPDDVGILEEIVVDVIWDGVEQGLSEEDSEENSEEEREYYSDGNTTDDYDDHYDDFSIGMW